MFVWLWLKSTVAGYFVSMIANQASHAKPPGERQRWMSLFARAETAELESVWAVFAEKPDYVFLRRPETGLVMIRGRAGGTGQPFNMGEMTVTRCAVQLAEGSIGHGYVAGRDRRHAELAAVFDALMQRNDARQLLEATLSVPVEERLAARRRAAAARTAATRVDFFTLVRGEDQC